MKITYKLIAKHIHKTEAGIKYLAKTNPDLLEIIKLGLAVKLNKISIADKGEAVAPD